MTSYFFYPSVGGIETVSMILAREFSTLGHKVTVVTTTPAGDAPSEFPFDVVRQPKTGRFIELLKTCDVFFQNNISMRTAWPLTIVRRPWVVAHHTTITRPDLRIGWEDRLKRWALRFARSISVSQAIAADLPVESKVIPNPYRDDVFHEMAGVERTRELAFLGRLVSKKGPDLLVDALGHLKTDGLTPRLTFIGAGEEQQRLQERAKSSGVDSQIEFAGMKTGNELVKLLNAHKIMAIPSREGEAFGVVALEGIACGCVVVGSDSCGLPDAIGPCGITFPCGDSKALASSLAHLLRNPERLNEYRQNARVHLQRHTPNEVAREYLEVLKTAVGMAR